MKLVTRVFFTAFWLQAHFNPHEREARDPFRVISVKNAGILIHTSVKLVTRVAGNIIYQAFILIHTSVKLVTKSSNGYSIRSEF